MKLVFATANKNKIREVSEVLGDSFEIIPAAEAGVTEEVPETGDTVYANSIQKAEYIHAKTGLDCFADDTGLEVEILGGAPGVKTARYAGEPQDSGRNMDKLLREMARRQYEASIMRKMGLKTPHATRRARFHTCITVIIGGVRHFFEGIMEGKIALERSGRGGFGYDPVFMPDGCDGLTAAELTPEHKNAISHRGKAVRAMVDFLKKQ
ncbi:MAG: RdgB/HAM1 family non-canonical purine NTP pyrophosphatase [Bacteroidales bacterium]|nr:RdgB/HAM1 family non-canonical purine NTP pyrophosphatase [Bacteroidales bacterium]